jgi:uncharacterized protein DUF4154
MHPRSRAMRLVATTGLGMLLGGSFMVPARADESYSRDEVIAAYLYRFTNYIDWPQRARGGFVIDVYGDPGVARALRRLLPEHPIHNEIAEVREVRSPRDLGDPQILYAGEAHADFLRAVAADAGRHVLMVTNEAQGLDVGSALNFVTVDKRVRFEVSLTAADRAGIKISSELLSVALRVHGGRRQSGHLCIRFGLPQDDDSPCSIREARRGPSRSIY